MAKSYPIAFRERVMSDHESGAYSDESLSDKYSISRGTLSKWKKLKKETGSVMSRKKGGDRKSKIGLENLWIVREIIEQEPDITQEEMCKRYAAKAGYAVNKISIKTALRKLGYTYKKNGYGERATTRKGQGAKKTVSR